MLQLISSSSVANDVLSSSAPRVAEKHVVEWRAAGDVAEVAWVFQSSELIEVGTKGPGDVGFASLVKAAPQIQECCARYVLHDDVCGHALLL